MKWERADDKNSKDDEKRQGSSFLLRKDDILLQRRISFHSMRMSSNGKEDSRITIDNDDGWRKNICSL